MILDLFRELGATFIKVGQIMSTRPDLLPEYVSNALAELQDDVGPFPFEDVVRTIEGDLRPPAGDHLRRVRAGAAGVGVGVAGAQGAPPDGRIVAVKVRRPNVVELCTFDLAVMRHGARLLNAIPSISTLAPVATVEEFGRAIFAQLDFRIEAANNRRFREQLSRPPRRRLPRGDRASVDRARS